MGPWKTSVVASFYTFEETEIFPYHSGRGEKRFLVRQTFDILVSGSYRVA